MAVYADHRDPPPEEHSSPVDLPDLSSLIASLGGQEGISAKLNSLLGNADSSQSPIEDETATQKVHTAPDISSLLGGTSPNMLSSLLGKSTNPNTPCGRLCALVSAISPFLNPPRRVKADKAIQILQILGASEKPVIDDDRLPLILLLIYLFLLP